MYLSIFVRVAKNLALYPRFMLSIQHVSIVVHNLWKKCIRYFYSQCAFNNVGHIWLMSSSRCWVMSPLWQGQEIYFLENDLGLTRRIKENCFKAWKHERKWLRAEIFQYRLTLSHCQKILSVKFPSPSNNQSSSIKLLYYSTHYETFWPSSN